MAKLHLAQQILDIIYPVGSIYLSWNSTNPSTYFGGTWVQLKGGFLYGFVESPGTGNGTGTATDANNGNTGSTTLTVEQMPNHIHGFQMAGTRLDSNGDGNMRMQASVNAGSGNFWNVSLARNGSGSHDGSMTGAGGGQGHTHTLNNHQHNIPYIAVSVWRRTA